MGIKEIFRRGMWEFKRQSSLRKEKKNLSQKEKLLSEQLTLLGKKAWESKLDIAPFGNSKELITNAQKQIDELNRQLSDLEKQKQDLENKKTGENDTFNARRKEVEDKKREVDTRLNNEKKQLKEAQREADNVENRLKQVNKEEEQLNTRAAAPETSDEQKSEIRQKLDAFKKEKEDLEEKRGTASEAIKTAEEKIKPLEEESAKFQKEIDQIRDEQREVIGQLDDSLGQANKEISDAKNQLAGVIKEQDGHFQQLGDKMADKQVSDEAVSSELSAVNDTREEMETIQLEIQSLKHQGTAESRGALWKMLGLIAAGVVVIAAIIVLLILLLSPGEKEPESPLASVVSRGEKITKDEGPEDAVKKFQAATAEIKKQSEQLQGKEIVAADKATFLSVLPDISGWKMEGTSYNKGAVGQLEYSALETTYVNPGGKKIRVNLSDTAGASIMLATYKMIFRTNMVKEHENGYEKISTYNGMPVIEKYTKNPPKASFVFIVKDRYLVNLRCREEDGIDLLKDFITHFDLSKLQ
jgi:chromosome segregation ATPase